MHLLFIYSVGRIIKCDVLPPFLTPLPPNFSERQVQQSILLFQIFYVSPLPFFSSVCKAILKQTSLVVEQPSVFGEDPGWNLSRTNSAVTGGTTTYGCDHCHLSFYMVYRERREADHKCSFKINLSICLL